MTPDQLNQLIAAVLSAVTRAVTTGTPSQGTTVTPVETPQNPSSSNIGWMGVSTPEQRKAFDAATQSPDGYKLLTTHINHKEKLIHEIRTRAQAHGWYHFCSIQTP